MYSNDRLFSSYRLNKRFNLSSPFHFVFHVPLRRETIEYERTQTFVNKKIKNETRGGRENKKKTYKRAATESIYKYILHEVKQSHDSRSRSAGDKIEKRDGITVFDEN